MRKLAISLGASFALMPVLVFGPLGAEENAPIVVRVEDARGPVGRPAELVARLSIKEGYRFIEPQPRGNRVIELSSADGGVSFARRVFRGRIEGDSIVFRLEVTPIRPGAHPINGVFRVSYVTDQGDSWHLRHVSLPLVATVTGTE
ncbi:MAG: hypothetical protein N2038_09615 [Geminicoccaceae bacterium]|nr:hypothetical protein [Geminicoccaceae bacterium]MCS7267090.1 hypothetical protein [Geminicoccaceae bacterium]MCX7630494.1 hypothetical protein [Geminicoccaceae bacterium]MDW8124960.1 hypothetical protein [Geminicoccaceae bacterium]MDW8342258.1 hypothetical protein [Geminicoccaceae bacterium]